MNQPYDPNQPYGGQHYGGEPTGYGPPPYEQQPPYGRQPQWGQQPYGQQSEFGSQPPLGQQPSRPPKSKLPILIAAGLVVALAIGVTLFFVLRDDKTIAGKGTGSSGGPEPKQPTAVAIVAEFFTAVDDVDAAAMKKVSRGDMLDDIEKIISSGGTDEITFATGNATDDASKKVDGVEIAIVIWELVDVPKGTDTSDDLSLAVSLLNDGDGYKVCYIDDPDGGAETMLDDWEYDYADNCNYKK